MLDYISAIQGKKFNRLTLLSYHGKKNKNNRPIVNCRCDCGKPVEVLLDGLKSGNTKSCGCLSREKSGQRAKEMATKLNKEQESNIISDYNAGVSVHDISNTYHIGLLRANEILAKNNIQKKSLSKILRDYNNYTLNEHVFDYINENSAYWVGFLMSDGNIYKDHIRLHIQLRDIAHLEKFKLFMGSNHRIKTGQKDGHPWCNIKFRSKYISKKLSEYNIVPNKTFITKTPDSLLFDKNYWRGMVDGDGTVGIYSGHACIGLSGTKEIVQEFLDFCNTIVSHNYTPHKHENIYFVRISCRIARKIIRYLYEGSNIYLNRKYETAMKIIKSMKEGE